MTWSRKLYVVAKSHVTTGEWKSSWMYSQSCEIKIKFTGGSQSILDVCYSF